MPKRRDLRDSPTYGSPNQDESIILEMKKKVMAKRNVVTDICNKKIAYLGAYVNCIARNDSTFRNFV